MQDVQLPCNLSNVFFFFFFFFFSTVIGGVHVMKPKPARGIFGDFLPVVSLLRRVSLTVHNIFFYTVTNRLCPDLKNEQTIIIIDRSIYRCPWKNTGS